MLKRSVKISFLTYIVSLFIISEHETLYIFSNFLFLMFLIFAALDIFNKKKIKINNIMLVYFFVCTYAAVSCLWAPIFSDAITRTMTVLQLSVMLLVTYNSFSRQECISFLVRCIWIGGLCLCIAFLSQYSFGEVIESYTTKFRLGEKIAPLNAVGRNIAIFNVVNIYYIVIHKQIRYVAPLLLGIVIMSATQSRTSILLCFMGGLVIVAFKICESRLARFATVLIGAVLILITVRSDVVHAMFWRVYKMFIFLADTSNMDVDYSAFVRLNFIKKGLSFISEKPLIGYGIASSYHLLEGDYFHNNYIQIWVELGIIGMLSYYGPMLYIILKALRRPKEEGNIIGVLFVAMILAGDFVNTTYYHKFTYILLSIAMLA